MEVRGQAGERPCHVTGRASCFQCTPMRRKRWTLAHKYSAVVLTSLTLGASLIAGCAPHTMAEEDAEQLASDLTTSTYQAENASVSGAIKASTHSGYTGSGYVDYQNVS